jgi:hypothetical protein
VCGGQGRALDCKTAANLQLEIATPDNSAEVARSFREGGGENIRMIETPHGQIVAEHWSEAEHHLRFGGATGRHK